VGIIIFILCILCIAVSSLPNLTIKMAETEEEREKKKKRQSQSEKNRDKELDTCKAWVAQLVNNKLKC
jgi:Na+-transporting methylmalonyl-CoA/oxaloacetate decarboxylase gamma subunit